MKSAYQIILCLISLIKHIPSPSLERNSLSCFGPFSMYATDLQIVHQFTLSRGFPFCLSVPVLPAPCNCPLLPILTCYSYWQVHLGTSWLIGDQDLVASAVCWHQETISRIENPGILAFILVLRPISSLDLNFLICKIKRFYWVIIKLSSNPEESGY